MERFHKKGKSAFLISCAVSLVIGLIVFGIEKLVQHLWVENLFSLGIGSLYMVFFTVAVLGVFLNFLGSFGDKIGFIGFVVGTAAAFIFTGVNLASGVANENMFNVLSCVPVPIVLYGYYLDHYVTDEKTHTTEHAATAGFLALILVLGLGIADACITKQSVSMIIAGVVIGALYALLLGVWIPRFIKQGTLPFSAQITYTEEDANSAIYHEDFPSEATIRECRDIISAAMKSSHITRGLGEFVADYQVSAPFTDMIVITLWFKEKNMTTKNTSAYFHSRNVLYARLRAMTEDCPYRVSWDVQGVDGHFSEYLSPTEW